MAYIFDISGAVWTWLLKFFWPRFAFSEILIDNDGGWAGCCLVQRIEPVRLLKSASTITITLRASSVSNAYIDRVYISRADPAGDPYDSAADLMAVWTTPFVIPANTSVTLPLPPPPNVFSLGEISYSLDAKQPLLIAVDFSAAPSSGIRCKKAVPADQARAYRKSAAAEAAKADRHSYSPYPGVYLIENIKVGGVFLIE
jgi:hypothetical protein